MAAMQLLAALAAAAAEGRLRGATLLDLLHERAGRTAGDANARRLLQRLLRAATAPYFRCLSGHKHGLQIPEEVQVEAPAACTQPHGLHPL